MKDLKNLERHVVSSSLRDKIFLFYGNPGTWKTTVATGDKDHTLLIAFEIGYKFIPGIFAVPVSSWIAFKQYLNQFNDPEILEKYHTIVIDTIGLAYKACVSYICSTYGVKEIGDISYGKGYSLARNEFEKTINSIPQKGIGLFMIAHSDELIDEKQNVSAKADIDKRPSAIIKGLADFILYARKEVDEKTNEEVVYAYSETTANVEVKKRARFFPKRFLFTYEKLCESMKDAVEKQNNFYGVESKDEADFEAYSEEKIDLEGIKTKIIEIATLLSDYPDISEKVAEILQRNLKGVRVGEATNLHIASLFSAYDELKEIRDTLNA